MLKGEVDNKPRILLVDDSIADVKLALHALQRHIGLGAVAVVRDGQEALDFLFGQGKYSNSVNIGYLRVILLDLKLPKVNGVEVLRAIKGHERTQSIPVVVLTSSNQDRDLRDCYRLGANSYVQKPVDFDRFQELIERIEQYWLSVNYAPPLNSAEIFDLMGPTVEL